MTNARYRSLDGLRGLAALVVVVHHVLLNDRELALSYLPGGEPTGFWAVAFSYSPLHLVWVGGEAVIVFFLLSGFVLAVPAVHGRQRPWRAYYPSRLIRLYAPSLAALAVAVVQARWLRPRDQVRGASWWFNDHVGAGSGRAIAHDAVLVKGTGSINSAFWSLQWEVGFSLALPAYLLLLRVRRPLHAAIAAAALTTSSLAGAATDSPALQYLPIFGLGVLACRHREALGEVSARRSRSLLLAAAVLLSARWAVAGLAPDVPGRRAAEALLVLAGASCIVVAFLAGPVARWADPDGRVQWLGRRSFSLYLVHEPIIVTITHLLGDRPPVVLVLLLALPLSLLAAELFGRAVEEPSHRLSQRVAAALQTRQPRQVVFVP